jgi:hypothetical protein
MSWRESFRYPHPTNEVVSRLVAAQVAVLAIGILAFDWPTLVLLLAYGFAARLLAGPRWSPMAQLAQRVLMPALGNPRRPTAGPPKRFAQGIGLLVCSGAAVAWLILGRADLGRAILGVLVVFAALEALVGFCAGCLVFRLLMRWGWIPEQTCERCQNLTFPARSSV